MTVFSNIANEIYNGNIKYEFSKKALKNPTHRMFLYEKAPVKMVTGYINISNQFEVDVKEFYSDKKEYFDKFDPEFIVKNKDIEKLFVYEIKSVQKFDNPKLLSEFGKKAAPQSIQYVDEIYENIT